MKRGSDSLFLGLAICIGCFMALIVATSVIRKVRAQAPEQNNPAASAPAPEPMAEIPQQATPQSLEMPPPPDETAAPAIPPALDASQDPGMRTMNPEGYIYDPTGRRDPFFPPMTLTPINPSAISDGQQDQGPKAPLIVSDDPLLAYYLRDYRLIGILWEVRDPKAIVRTPDSRVLTLHLKMKLGRENALVAAIRESEVVVMEPDEKGEYRKGRVHRIRMKN